MAKKSHTEWDITLAADEVGMDTAIRMDVDADEETCAMIAERINVQSIESLEAALVIERDAGGLMLTVDGHLEATIIQPCIYTLEPVESHVNEGFKAYYIDSTKAVPFSKKHLEREAQTGDLERLMREEEHDPEELVDGHLDLGDLIIQYLSLYADPYPMTEEAKNRPAAQEEAPKTTRPNPFEALKYWRKEDTQ